MFVHTRKKDGQVYPQDFKWSYVCYIFNFKIETVKFMNISLLYDLCSTILVIIRKLRLLFLKNTQCFFQNTIALFVMP